MKTKIRISLLLVVIMALSALKAQAAEADRRDFWMLNATGINIVRAYVSPHSDSTFDGSNVLKEDDSIVSGDGRLIVFSSNISTGCNFDFKLVFEDGTSQTYDQGANICTIHAIEFENGQYHAW
jgi:hypothetical protein